MISNLKKIKVLKKFFDLKNIPLIKNKNFIHFENGDIWFIGDKKEYEIFLSRYNEDEKKFIKEKTANINDFFILLISTKQFSLSELLPKNDFSLINKESNILLHIPHDSIKIPKWCETDFIINNIYEEALKMSDWKVSELIWEEQYNHSSLKSNISRICVDFERFKDDKNEPMSKLGMGKFYSVTSDKKKLRFLSKTNEKKLELIYDNYHSILKNKSIELINKYKNNAYILDIHSYPDEDRWYETKNIKPDVCLGFNNNMDLNIINYIKKIFEESNYSVEFNNPYSGSIVPKGININSIMIEINRKLYLTDDYIYIENKKLKETLSRVINYLKLKN